MKSEVSLLKCNSYDQIELINKVREAFSLLGGITKFIKPGSKVLLKPNLLMASYPEKNITTHPEFVRAIARILKEINCDIYLGDGPSVFGGQIEDVTKVYETTGMKRISDEEGLKLVVFDKRFMHNYFPLTTYVKECDYIVNLPKLKTHEFMVLTGAVKNLFGLIPGTFKMEFHKNFYKADDFAAALLDIYQAAKPAISIIDGIAGIEGNGPATSGQARDFGVLLASSDAVSLDCVLAHLINIKPEYIYTNLQAKRKNIGNTDLSNIDIKGENLQTCRIENFRLPEANLSQAIRKKLPVPIVKILKKIIYFRPKIDSDICKLCESCIKSCPQKKIFLKNGNVIIDYSHCISCFCCREVCPYGAIKMQKSFLAKLLGM